MIRRMLAIAQITIFETLSRKHLYVLLIVMLAIYFYFGRLEFFNLGKDASFLKLIPITGLSLFGLIVSIFAAARQLPDEIAQKTVFPLLAKPVTRLEFVTGKFAGVWIVTALSMAAVAAMFAAMLWLKGIALNQIFWQAAFLQTLQMACIIAMVLMLSTVLSQAANLVLSFLLYYLLGSAGATLEDMLYAKAFPKGLEWMQYPYTGLSYLLPRLDLFNISKAVVHDAQPKPWTIVLPFLGYATAVSAVFLVLAAVLFRRKDL